MKKIIYTLILCFFALNLSARIYIVSNVSALEYYDPYVIDANENQLTTTPLNDNGKGGFKWAHIVENGSATEIYIEYNGDYIDINQAENGGAAVENAIYEFYMKGNTLSCRKISTSYPTFKVTIKTKASITSAQAKNVYDALFTEYAYKQKTISGTTCTYYFYTPFCPNGAEIYTYQFMYRNPSTGLMERTGVASKRSGTTDNSNCEIELNVNPNYPKNGYTCCYFLSHFTVITKLNITNNSFPSEKQNYTEFATITNTVTYTYAQVANWIWITTPFNATISVSQGANDLHLTWPGNSATAKTACFVLKSFNSAKRAASRTDYWDDMKTTTLEAGKGYLLGIDPRGDKTNITVTYTSTASRNTIQSSFEHTLAEHSGPSSYANQHLIGTGGFFNTNHVDASRDLYYALPTSNGFSYLSSGYEAIDLAPFKPFFVQTYGTLTFYLNQTSNVAALSPKLVEPQITKETYRLLIEGNDFNDQTTIILDQSGTEGYTIGEDFFYFTTDVDGIPFANQFYTIDQDEPRSFNHRKNENQTISLGGRIQTAGEYTLSLKEINTKAKSVLLTDILNQTTTELTADNYTFTANEGEILDGRFIITFTFAPATPTDTYVAEANQIVVFGNAQNCNINNLTIGEIVMIYDATGRLVYNETAKSENINISLIPGTYIVRQPNKSARFAVK